MGDRAKRKMVFLEWTMERRREGRSGAIGGGISSHRRRDARGDRRQSAMGLARELARSTGSKMEPVRELLSGGKLLRLGGAERLWPAHAARGRRHGKFPIQDGNRLPAL